MSKGGPGGRGYCNRWLAFVKWALSTGACYLMAECFYICAGLRPCRCAHPPWLPSYVLHYADPSTLCFRSVPLGRVLFTTVLDAADAAVHNRHGCRLLCCAGYEPQRTCLLSRSSAEHLLLENAVAAVLDTANTCCAHPPWLVFAVLHCVGAGHSPAWHVLL